MNKLNNIKQQLEVFQICDSTFPIGSFNHSYGMETYLREEKVTDDTSFLEWLLIFLDTQFLYNDGLVIKLCYEALDVEDFEKVIRYDRELTVATVAIETRNGAKMVAKQMAQLILSLYEDELLVAYQEQVKEGVAFGHPAIVFALFAFNKGLTVEEAIMYYGYSLLSTIVQNAVRAIPIGQKVGQQVLQTALEHLEEVTLDILNLDVDFLGANMPGMELAQMNHEVQVFRLFMS